MSRTVYVIGEALVDVVRMAGSINEIPGGSPANVACGLGRLGVETTFLTHLAVDGRGQALVRHLTEAGVRLADGSSSAARTSTATAIIDRDGVASYEFDLEWALPEKVQIPPARIVHTGSIASFLEPGASSVAKLLRRARGSSLISYDPNIRPSIIGYRFDNIEAFESIASLSDVVKLSDEDSKWLYPDLSIEASMEHILDLGPTLVAMTRGSAGSTLMTQGFYVEIRPVKVNVVDTIGAGDTYMASLLYSLLDVDPAQLLESGLRLIGERAAVAAAITVSRPGADLPTFTEVNSALAR